VTVGHGKRREGRKEKNGKEKKGKERKGKERKGKVYSSSELSDRVTTFFLVVA
jgi:hypothetical protein